MRICHSPRQRGLRRKLTIAFHLPPIGRSKTGSSAKSTKRHTACPEPIREMMFSIHDGSRLGSTDVPSATDRISGSEGQLEPRAAKRLRKRPSKRSGPNRAMKVCSGAGIVSPGMKQSTACGGGHGRSRLSCLHYPATLPAS